MAAASPPAAWTAATLDPRWCRTLSGDEVAELDTALQAFKLASPQLDPAAMTAASFPLPGLATGIASLRSQLVDGPGVAAFEGFPVDRYRVDELRAIWWGLARAIGTPVSQSHRGDLIGDVRDLGTGIAGRTGRGYTSNAELNFHADAADVSGLFFLRIARHGGETRIASALATHDAIAARRPDLLAELYRPLPWSWQGNEPLGERGWYEMPVFGRSGDDLACAYVRTNILLAHRNTGAPELTAAQREAVQMVADVAAEPGMWVERRFGPGAMLFVNNHTVLHLRTAFVDWDEPASKRHLLRVWLSPPNSRPLPGSFAPFFGDVGAGAVRGGYRSRADRPVFHTA
jgi:hypothetical protein